MAFTPMTRRILRDGTQYKIYAKPQFYKNSLGEYKDIDLSTKDATSSIGNIKLTDSAPISMGTRTDGNKTKFIGFRPDENQSGSEQLEFSLSTVIIDGAEVSISLAQSEVTEFYTDLTDLRILKSSSGYKQLFKVPEAGIENSFRIEYIVNVTGLSVSEVDGNFVFTNNNEDFRFFIGRPSVMNSKYNILHVEVSHELTLESEGVYRYVKHVENFDFTQFDDVSYLDATTQYVQYDGAPLVSNLSWSTARGAAYGGSIHGGSSGTFHISTEVSKQTIFGLTNYHIRRYLAQYDTSAISGINIAYYYARAYVAGIGAYSLYPNGTHIIVKSTQTGSVSTFDYNNIDWNTPYSSPIDMNSWRELIGGSLHGGVGNDGYCATALNDTAIADINSGSYFNIAHLDYTYDWLNVAPPDSPFVANSLIYMYFQEYTGTSKDPYIWVDTETKHDDLLSSCNF